MIAGRRNLTLLHKRDTPAEWEASNKVLFSGEIGIETNSGSAPDRMKVGDGVTPWNSLQYMGATDLGVNGIASPTLSSIVVTTESEFSLLAVKDPTTAYLVLPDPA